MDPRSVAVAAWIGSPNLGDELVFAGLRAAVERAGIDRPIVALSVDPAATRAAHGVEAVPANDPRAIWRTVRHAGRLVFGGGGVVQDETSWFNLPYHLARPALARHGPPMAGVGLGAGPLDRPGSRQMVRFALQDAVALTVRDRPSADLLRDAGLEAVVGADLAWQLPPVDAAPQERLAVCLRPWTGTAGRLPVATRRRRTSPAWFVAAVAEALDRLVASTSLRCHFVALSGPDDDTLHHEVAGRLAAPSTFAVPGWRDVAGELAGARAVVSMRYHGGVAAALAGRASVLIGYSPKVEALAGDLGHAVAAVPWAATTGPALLQATERALDVGTDVVATARRRLVERGGVEVEALRRLEAAGG